jgi:hypothetical protein
VPREHSPPPHWMNGAVARLGSYLSADGPRLVLSVTCARGSALVIDCAERSHADPRLVARLAPDEPPENARIVTDLYLADDSRGRCRALEAEDLEPFEPETPACAGESALRGSRQLLDENGARYRLRSVNTGAADRAFRWTVTARGAPESRFDAVTLREVIGALQRYEPAREMTLHALAAHAEANTISTTVLSCELQRVAASQIVLNRGLRDAVQSALADGITMSTIAARCGRLKRDSRGNESGETSWLARRIGLMAEGGCARPTPWTHSDTLALIAREGLGVSPHEVEL